MAQYKVPQDVEADDKLIGPFSFRQFVYLLIAAGLIALAVGLFNIFPLLTIIPVPFVLFFLILALPLKKDQPMETYLAAIVSYYLKPHNRLWTPGQRESTILITAPKIVEEVRTRDISQEEATHRLSFLADIVDTEGQAIKGAIPNSMREEIVAEASATNDMFDDYKAVTLNETIEQNKIERHEEVIREMREAINRNENIGVAGAVIQNDHGKIETPAVEAVSMKAPRPEQMTEPAEEHSAVIVMPEPTSQEKKPTNPLKPSIMELANNSDFTVATIAKEANRIKRKDDGEVFISLH